ncbi:hypothetical protein [Sinorhizobium meliloti]|uniref:hypothetical protein n=1 Tax=Rhizobium meliloti TaxID=382 RepID=UPI000FDA36B5|nr:hypothetical protein [Sinorhizobium meliloti]RVH29557.1 hypothetical protein CN211_24085 [Sinorhizobium meliloti]
MRKKITKLPQRVQPVSPRKFNDLQSPGVPVQYDTVYGYFSRRFPDVFDRLDDPITYLGNDIEALVIRSFDMGRICKIVEAPKALRERGVERVLAFPHVVLVRQYRPRSD